MIKPIIKALILFSITQASFAAIINGGFIDGQGGNNEAFIADQTGTGLSTGYYGIGYFNLTDTQITTAVDSADISTLNNAFQQITSDNFTTGLDSLGLGSTAGVAYASVSGFDPTAGLNRTLYTFITNATSLGGSSLYILFRHTGVTLTADQVSPPVETTYSLNFTSGDLLIGEQTGPSSSVSIPEFGSVTFEKVFRLEAIPEPTTSFLAALGILALLRRRR